MKFDINGKEYNVSRINIFLLILIIVFLIIVMSVYFEGNTNEILVVDENEDENIESENSKIDSETEKVDVYIVGCVKNPGIINLNKGDLLNNAVEKAGGLTKDADLTKINMVFKIEENMMIKIMSKKEIEESQDEESKGFEVTVDMGEGVEDSSGKGDSNSEKVNINVASIDEIKTLPGIGDVLANNIISYREQNGNFKDINELKNVNGIGDKKFEDIKDLVSI
jgi:competence protein ComEA